MNAHAMSWALAGRIAVWMVLIILAYAVITVAVARLIRNVSMRYPKVSEFFGNGPEYDPLILAVAEYMAANEDMKRDAAVPIGGDAWLVSARRTEALAWLNDDDDPKRVA